jgi:preprotein translocase subunit SecG
MLVLLLVVVVVLVLVLFWFLQPAAWTGGSSGESGTASSGLRAPCSGQSINKGFI